MQIMPESNSCELDNESDGGNEVGEVGEDYSKIEGHLACIFRIEDSEVRRIPYLCTAFLLWIVRGPGKSCYKLTPTIPYQCYICYGPA